MAIVNINEACDHKCGCICHTGDYWSTKDVPEHRCPGPKPEDYLTVSANHRKDGSVEVRIIHSTHYVNAGGHWTPAGGGGMLFKSFLLKEEDRGYVVSQSIAFSEIKVEKDDIH